MQKRILWSVAFLSIVLLVGCKSPRFAYTAPPPSYNISGPTIQIMPIVDIRTDMAMDKVLEKGYLVDVQRAIADELRSINQFSSVIALTNSAESVTADFKLIPKLQRLDWEIPHYGALQAKAFTVGLLTGVIGGSIYAATSIDVYGHSVLDVRVEKTSEQQAVLDAEYSSSVTNRLKKAVCDTPKTKASMMIQAFQQTMQTVKSDVQQKMEKPVQVK